MNNSLKGALLSGLVFPGLGQYLFKQYLRGTIIIFTVLISMAMFILQVVEQAQTVLEKIQLEGGIIDNSTITHAVTQASTSSADNTLMYYLLIILALWIAGIIDAYKIGKKIDANRNSLS